MTAHTLFLITVVLVCLDIIITYKLYSGVEEYREDCFRQTRQQLCEIRSDLQSYRHSINSHIEEFEKKLKDISIKRPKSTKKNTGKTKE